MRSVSQSKRHNSKLEQTKYIDHSRLGNIQHDNLPRKDCFPNTPLTMSCMCSIGYWLDFMTAFIR